MLRTTHLLRLCAAVAVFALPGLTQGAAAAGGTLSPDHPTLSYSGGPFFVPNQSAATDTTGLAPVALPGGVQCAPAQAFPCDEYALTVQLPADYATTHKGAKVRIEVRWDDPSAAGAVDFDLYVLDADGNEVDHSASLNNPEVVNLTAGSGTRALTLRVVPAMPAGQGYTATVSLVAGATGGGGGGTPPPVAAGAAPRYVTYAPPRDIAQDAGEPSIGYNPKTGRVMFLAATQTAQITFPDLLTPALPAVCDAQWKDVSYTLTNKTTMDPIMYTDAITGRTFVSQMNSVLLTFPAYVGLNSYFAYTDDDGASWTPGQIDPPEGGYDHQTVGSGPYPATLPAGINPVYENAVYYCSQAGVTAYCSRSDTGGLTFPHGIPIYTLLDCTTIHGHVRVGPDGTVYVPNARCNGQQGVAVSEDAGLTWAVRKVADSTEGTTDPQMALARDGTGYFCYVDGSGHPRAAVTKDHGKTWSASVDIGAAAGIENAVFSQGIAGDKDRAACAFIGTTAPGNYEAADFAGVWYPYIATSYDGGKTWHTVNTSPNDPVQREGGICTSGIACSGNNRNLLDFNEIAMDKHGAVIFGYADGCVGDCEKSGPNSFTSVGKIVRQTGGRTLLAAFDNDHPEQSVPAASCLAGSRDSETARLSWRVPDSGGAAIDHYLVYRGTSADNLSLLGRTGKNAYNDRSADGSVAKYVYKVTAVNAQGEGIASNLAELPATAAADAENLCLAPGLKVLVDPKGDSVTGTAGTDIWYVGVSEPQALTGKLVFTMKTDSLSQLPPDARWAVRFNTGKPPANGDEDYYVAMVTVAGQPSFEYGTTVLNTTIPAPVPFTSSRQFTRLGDLETGTQYNADGTITMILDYGKVGLKAAGSIVGITSRISELGAPNQAGNIKAVLSDVTGDGSYHLRSADFCLPNTAPTPALVASSLQGQRPFAVEFDAGGSADADGIDHIASYTFNFGDGSEEVTQDTPKIRHTFNDAALYTVKLEVTDSRGKRSAGTAKLLVTATAPVTNHAPLAALAADVGSGAVPLTVHFSGAGSSDPDAGDHIASYVFDFGDGSPAVTQTTAEAQHTYTAAGSYTATLSVTDSGGTASASPASQVITAGTPPVNRPPQVRLRVDGATTVTRPATVQLQAFGYSDPDNDAAAGFIFNCGDGSADQPQQVSAAFGCRYQRAGIFLPSVKPVDARGGQGLPATTRVVVTDPITGKSGAGAGGAVEGSGALGTGLLLPLLGIGLWRRRRRH